MRKKIIKAKKVKMINPRGRVVEVFEREVEKMEGRGFSKADPSQTHEYNPVFDRMEGTIASAPGLGEIKKGVREFLDVEKI